MKRFLPLTSRNSFSSPSSPRRHAIQPVTNEYVREWGTPSTLIGCFQAWGNVAGNSNYSFDFELTFDFGVASTITRCGDAYGGIPTTGGTIFIDNPNPITSQNSPVSSIGLPSTELLIGGIFDFSLLPIGTGDMGILSVGLGDDTETATLYYNISAGEFVFNVTSALFGGDACSVIPTQLGQWRWCILVGTISENQNGMDLRVIYPDGTYDESPGSSGPGGGFCAAVEDPTSVARLCPIANLGAVVASSFLASSVFFAAGEQIGTMLDLTNLLTTYGSYGLARDPR